MTSTNFNTATQTLRQLFGNDLTYRVPRFQRDYSWDEDEWQELWQDISNLLTGEDPVHYMGYLVLKSSAPKTVDVIDGQQRMTTLSLLVLAVLKSLEDLVARGVEPENNKKRIDQLRASYIGHLDPVTLVSKPKLSLNRHNDHFYRDRLVSLQRLSPRGLKAPERHLKRAFEWFCTRVGDRYSDDRNGARLAKFLDDLADKLLFTAIYVTDDLNAYKVFETLNARGVRLSPTDLLKNYLFSVVDKNEQENENLESLERHWDNIVEQLGTEDFSAFLRVHWNSRHDFVREAELFKTISGQVRDKGRVFELIRELQDDLVTYVALTNPRGDAVWTQQQRKHVDELNLFGIRQLLSLLLAARRVLDDADFTILLRVCSVITFRYTIIAGLANNLLESTYSSAAMRIAEGHLRTANDILMALKPVYVSDDAFHQSFSEKIIKTSGRGNRIARQILFALERHLSGRDLNAEGPTYSIEHILPENPRDFWPQFDADQLDDFTYRLGNLTLLTTASNRQVGNESWPAKREVLRQSEFAVSAPAARVDSWTAEAIHRRQVWMADQAKTIWRVSQFD